MFLGKLDQLEKEAFVSLAVHAAGANGVVENEEYQMIEEYCQEMGIAFFDARNLKTMESVISTFSGSEMKHKKIVVLELIGLMYADTDYDDEERSFVKDFTEKIGVLPEDTKKMEEVLLKYIDMTKELLECIG